MGGDGGETGGEKMNFSMLDNKRGGMKDEEEGQNGG